jgi:hypothetical protein
VRGGAEAAGLKNKREDHMKGNKREYNDINGTENIIREYKGIKREREYYKGIQGNKKGKRIL